MRRVKDALRQIDTNRPDLVVLDVMLPELDGISVAETIRLQNNDVPILMVSARNTTADVDLGDGRST